jgi:hypothetical protein
MLLLIPVLWVGGGAVLLGVMATTWSTSCISALVKPRLHLPEGKAGGSGAGLLSFVLPAASWIG